MSLRGSVAPAMMMMLVLAACATGADNAQPTPSPIVAGATELTPSGLTLVGVPDGEPHFPPWQRWQMGADGEQQVWFRGPWQLVRLDPETGEVSVWDASDDLSFASVESRLVPSSGSGVWLLEPDRVRLFDGTRFARDLPIPAELRNVPDGPAADGYPVDLVEVGDEVWISVLDTERIEQDGMCCLADPRSAGWVLRWSAGSWTPMSEPGEGIGGNLAVDAEGSAWSAGVLLPEDDTPAVPAGAGVVHRWDGDAWTVPGMGQGAAPTEPGDLVADPGGGIWFVSWADGLRRFEGATWRPAGGDTYPIFGGGWRERNGQLAVSTTGEAWLAGGEGIVRVPSAGPPTLLGEEAGFTGLSGLAVAGSRVVVLDQVDALRLVDDRFEPLWQGSRSADWVGGQSSVRAPSADEVWVWDATRWMGHRDGAWAPVGPQPGVFGPGTFASDGASWAITLEGLERFDPDGGRSRIAPAPDGGFESDVVAGPDGSVWVASGGEVRRYSADGPGESIGRPAGWPAVCLVGAGPEGSVWAVEWSGAYPIPDEPDDDYAPCSTPQPTFGRWDGSQWTEMAAPPGSGYLSELVGVEDGSAWAVFSGIPGAVARVADGQWARVGTVPGFRGLLALPEGLVCGLGRTESITVGWVACYGPTGQVAVLDVRGMGVQDFAVAPGGEVWVRAPQLARLPEGIPLDR